MYSYRLTARVLLYAPSHRQDNLLRTAKFLLPSTYCELPNFCFPQPIANCQISASLNLLRTAKFLLPSTYCELPNFCFPQPIANCQISASLNLLRTAKFLLPSTYCELPNFCFPQPIANCQISASLNLLRTAKFLLLSTCLRSPWISCRCGWSCCDSISKIRNRMYRCYSVMTRPWPAINTLSGLVPCP